MNVLIKQILFVKYRNEFKVCMTIISFIPLF